MLAISELLWDEWSSYSYDSYGNYDNYSDNCDVSACDADGSNDNLDCSNSNCYEAECLGMLAGILPDDKILKNENLNEKNIKLKNLYLKIKTARRLIKIWPYTDLAKLNGWNIAKMLEFDNLKINKKRRVRLAESQERGELLNHVKNSNVSWPWISGLFGSCGGFYLTRPGCYLVLRVPNENIASRAENFFNKNNKNKNWTKRYFRGAYELILREQEGVVTFFSNIGLNSTALELENRVIMRLMRDQANRASNCDTANIIRATRAASQQIELARKIFNEGIIQDLPENLRELVFKRLENPEANLSELGEKLSPPISKSTVKYRWAKLNNYIKN